MAYTSISITLCIYSIHKKTEGENPFSLLMYGLFPSSAELIVWLIQRSAIERPQYTSTGGGGQILLIRLS
jgi:hypothetical protein